MQGPRRHDGKPTFAMDGSMAIQHHQSRLDQEQSGEEKLALNNQAQAMFTSICL
jgi:hypothetical protein